MNIENLGLQQFTAEQLEKSAKMQAKKFYTEAEQVLKKHMEEPSEELIKEVALSISKPLNVISHLPQEALDSNPAFSQIAKFWELVNLFLLSKSFE